MQMSAMEFIQLVLVVGGGVVGWFLKVLFSRIEGLERADRSLAETITELRVSLPSHYVTKDDFKASLDGIHGALRRIEDRLNASHDPAS